MERSNVTSHEYTKNPPSPSEAKYQKQRSRQPKPATNPGTQTWKHRSEGSNLDLETPVMHCLGTRSRQPKPATNPGTQIPPSHCGNGASTAPFAGESHSHRRRANSDFMRIWKAWRKKGRSCGRLVADLKTLKSKIHFWDFWRWRLNNPKRRRNIVI